MVDSRLQGGPGTHINKLTLSAVVLNALDSNGRHGELLYEGRHIMSMAEERGGGELRDIG